jgi:hypothetical protein
MVRRRDSAVSNHEATFAASSFETHRRSLRKLGYDAMLLRMRVGLMIPTPHWNKPSLALFGPVPTVTTPFSGIEEWLQSHQGM